jgi:hypothetical protein
MFAIVLLELTFREVLAGVPVDAGAVVVYAILGLFVGFIWHGSRKKSGSGSAAATQR